MPSPLRIRFDRQLRDEELDTLQRGLGTAAQDALGQLSASTRGVDELLASLQPDERAELTTRLQRLCAAGLLAGEVALGDRTFVHVAPIPAGYRWPGSATPLDERVTLSRFAYLHRIDHALVLESPFGPARMTIVDPTAARLIAELAKPTNPDELAYTEAGELVDVTLRLLDAMGALERAGGVDETLTSWEFHDLLFHARSRLGRHRQPSGATFRQAQTRPPLAAVKPIPNAPAIELGRPGDDRGGPPIFDVMADRTSTRSPGPRPIDIDQLGELLFRSARVTKHSTSTREGPYPVAHRPYPGAGACHELELYLTISDCRGVDPGFYYYHPDAHALYQLAPLEAPALRLLETARQCCGAERRPQVLVTIAARVGRVFWKYSSGSYALILKDVGVLYQTIYLAAAALGVGVCGLGNGNSDDFEALARTGYYPETAVGELVLGSLPRTQRVAARTVDGRREVLTGQDAQRGESLVGIGE